MDLEKINLIENYSIKIAHLSDSHMKHELFEPIDVDFFFHTGDFCNIDFNLLDKEGVQAEQLNSFEQAKKFLLWLSDYPATYKVLVSGNHETFLNNEKLRNDFEAKCDSHGVYFKDDVDEIVNIGGLRIGGAGSYPHISNYMTHKHAYFIQEGYYSQVPDAAIDVYLSHVPPLVSHNQFECAELDYFIRSRDAYRVPIVLCGHIHEANGVYKTEDTYICNSAVKGRLLSI